MHTQIAPRLSKWPFLMSDLLLLGLAFLVYAQSKLPLGRWEIIAITLCVVVGAGCSVLPFILEFRVLVRLIEAEQLTSAVDQIRNLDRFAGQISEATDRWVTVQESADKTARAASEIAARMEAEAKAFSEFIQNANEGEKSALRLEVEKLRRAEADWVQVLVRVLDHVFALHQAALRSQQPGLIDQLTQFQNVCRDAARRVGLTPFVAAPAERFDATRHRPAEADGRPQQGTPPEAGTVEETLATGFTFQGRLLRPALVRLRNGQE